MQNNTSTQIIRQSQIKTAMEFLREKGIQPSLVELLTMTEVLTDYVTNGTNKEVMDRVRSVDGWIKSQEK